MTSDTRNRSALTEGLSAAANWEDLVAWHGEEELYHPLFQGDVDVTDPSTGHNGDLTSSFQAPENGFEQYYVPFSATSILEGPLSDYAVSAPPSIIGPKSLDHGQSWLSGSPSYTTTATSPLMDRGGLPYSGSFDIYDDGLSPLRMSNASPFHDTQSFGSSSSYQTAAVSAIFNPYLASSPHSFSGLDVTASQAFSNVGTWAEPSLHTQPNRDEFHDSQRINTISEHEGAIPIPIPQGGAHGFTNTFASHPWDPSPSHEQQETRPTHPHAIRIPQTQFQRPPPLLSVSPETRRLPRSVLMSRSNVSRSEPRRSRNRLTTSSPTSNEFGWVSYQPNAQTLRLIPCTDGSRGRRSRGRVGALTLEQRNHAAVMRRIGSCYNCRKRKEKCDIGTPCQSCLEHFKGDLFSHPCRGTSISALYKDFLSERLGWHPTDRAIDSFITPHGYNVSTEEVYHIPLKFGFGPLLHLPVHAIDLEDTPTQCHDHIIYSWPPSATSFRKDTNAVLPAVLTPEARFNLQETLDTHLTLLVQQHFQFFPLYCSPLRILRDIYILYRTLPTTSAYSRLLHQALKLLVLVHIGGDITLPSPSADSNLEQLVNAAMSLSEPITPTPCFIRSQFGSIMPSLALSLMKEVLGSLEQMFLNREPHEWPIALATLLVVLITIESIQYHAAKLPYHHSYDAGASQLRQENDSKADDDGVKALLSFYSACFSGCHARLGSEQESESPQSRGNYLSPEDKFVENVKEAIKKASPGGYLERKAEADRVGDDMAFFFDRLAARVLVLKT